ncbi:MAG: ABC transporter ATP-binding protein [Armatimonadota bacterium]|nr:ABC transporter ATP-binding protein [Armatimonadota bacterium]
MGISGRIEVVGLRKAFGHKEVLRGISLSVEPAEAVAILGPSGCGKSVLLKHVVGLLTPDAGEVRLNGVPVHRMTSEELQVVRSQIGMVFQGAALFDSLSVGENVAFPLRRHRNLRSQEVEEIVAEKLRLVGMEGTEDLMPSDLSGGMRKRVGIARALALNPVIVLYDEPTAGLDPVTARAVDRLMVRLHEQMRTTTVVVTHDLVTAFAVAQRIAVMHEGLFVALGTPQQIRTSSDPIVAEFVRSSALGTPAAAEVG